MKYTYLLLLGFFLPVLTFAQANYHQGYIVLNQGDTVRGYINNREWAISPKAIEFKGTPTDKAVITYPAADIKSFTVTGIDHYISYQGRISTDANEFATTPSALDTVTRQDTILLKYIIEGAKVSLLRHADKVKTRYFVQETGMQPVELSYHTYYNNNNSAIIYTRGYQVQLNALAQKYDADERTSRLLSRMSSYNIPDIEHIIYAINNEQQSQQQRHSGSRFFAGGGLNLLSTSFDGENQFTTVGASNKVLPFLSAGYDFFQNVNTQRVIFRGELNVSYNPARFRYTAPTMVTNVNSYFTFNQLNFAIVPQLVYNFYSTDQLKIYIDIGFAYNLSVYSNNKYTYTVATNSSTAKNYYPLENSWLSFPVKAGVFVNKRLELYAQYIHPAAYTNFVYFSVATRNIGLGVHYCFGSTK